MLAIKTIKQAMIAPAVRHADKAKTICFGAFAIASHRSDTECDRQQEWNGDRSGERCGDVEGDAVGSGTMKSARMKTTK